MTTPQELIRGLDVSHFHHAYGLATDTAKLVGLFGDEHDRDKAVEYLDTSVLHQGTSWPVTAPIGAVLVKCLPLTNDPQVKTAILEFTGAVSDSINDSVDMDHLARLKATIDPRIWRRLREEGQASDPELWLAMNIQTTQGIVNSRTEWAQAALLLIHDRDVEVALWAMRKRSLRHCESSAQPLKKRTCDSMKHPVELNEAFPKTVRFVDWFPTYWGSSRAAKIENVPVGELVDMAIAEARRSHYCEAGYGWEPYMVPVFRDAEVGRSLRAEQRRLLEVFVAIQEFWDRSWGWSNIESTFHRVGLPFSRQKCRQLSQGEQLEALDLG